MSAETSNKPRETKKSILQTCATQDQASIVTGGRPEDSGEGAVLGASGEDVAIEDDRAVRERHKAALRAQAIEGASVVALLTSPARSSKPA